MKVIQLIKTGYLKLVFILVIISTTWVNFNHTFWQNEDVITHDVKHYYSYLPAFFYEKDLKLNFLNDSVNQKIELNYYNPNKAPNSNYIIKMSMGMAISYLPFFTAAHFYCKLFNVTTNGFTSPYHFALQFSTLIYFLIGLFYLWKVLVKFYNKTISTITLLIICFATNVFFYLTFKAALSHIVGFTLIALFLYLTIGWYQKQNLKYSIALGCVIGFLTLVRPINVLVVIFFVLYNVKNKNDLQVNLKLYWTQKLHVAIIVLFSFLVVLPQLIYWKYITNQYFFNSYVGENFYFFNPHIFKAIFGFRKGWLIYTPVMVFSLIGILFIYKQYKQFYLAIVIFLIIYIYITFSWWCWWYGGSFSQRVMIDIYPILAIPLSAFLKYISQLSNKKIIAFSTLIIFLTLLNLFQTTQAKFNIIHYDSMTFKSYVKAFGVITNNDDIKKLYQPANYPKALKGEDEN